MGTNEKIISDLYLKYSKKTRGRNNKCIQTVCAYRDVRIYTIYRFVLHSLGDLAIELF